LERWEFINTNVFYCITPKNYNFEQSFVRSMAEKVLFLGEADWTFTFLNKCASLGQQIIIMMHLKIELQAYVLVNFIFNDNLEKSIKVLDSLISIFNVSNTY
jgi:hypothetical protein